MSAHHTASLHVGYSLAQRDSSPYARFFQSELPPLAGHVEKALLVGTQFVELFPVVQEARKLMASGYWPVETGYAVRPDGSVQVFVLTEMPGVAPAMWDWWFAWHGSEAQRYKPQEMSHLATFLPALHEAFGLQNH